MPQIKLVTNVSEYALLRGLARSRGRLIVSTICATAAMVGFGLWSAHYILEESASVGLNLGLITFNMMVMLVAAYLQTILIGDLTFSGPWREQVVLGEQTSTVTVQSHNAEFMILLLILVVANGLVVNFGSGGFLDTYHTEGFFRSRLRSEVPEERVAALQYMTDPVNFEMWPLPGVQQLVLEHLDDGDVAARLAAIWDAGEMNITDAREELRKIVADPKEDLAIRAEAAEAVGKLGLDETGRETLEAVLKTDAPPRLLVGALRGLALMKSPLSLAAAEPLTKSTDELVMLHAYWVLRNSGEPHLRAQLHEELDANPTGQRLCAILDTLKMVATEEDATWARRAFDRVDAEAKCEPVIWEERNERQHYVLYSDTFRVKYLKIVANGSGAAHRDWFERIVRDPDQPWRVREVAQEIVKRIDDSTKSR